MPTPPAVRIEASPEKLRRLKELRAQVAEARRHAPRRFTSPGELARHCEPSTLQTPALELIDSAAVAILDGQTRKQQIAAPPQTGKSQRVSRWTPLWMLVCDPALRIAIVSAEKELAVRWGRQIKRDLEANPDLGLELRSDSQAAGRWETSEGGGLFCTGVAAGTTGRPIDVLIIDDPVKDRAAAESKTMRDRAWDFWENDASVRARRVILMATRWHVDDLAGRLQEREAGSWSVLSIPAIADADDDALGRTLGEEIQSANPELHPPGYFTQRRKSLSAYVWSSLYQQSPTAGEGNIFKRGDWRYWTHATTPDSRRWLHLRDESFGRDERFDLNDCHRFITIDLATSTRTSADFTVAAAWAITPSGDLVLLDRVRARVAEMDHAEFLEPLRSQWLSRYDVVHIEAAAFGTTLVYALGRAGVPVAKLDADTDKVTRALAAAGLVRQHKIFLPRDAAWLDEWLDEHADFDKGKNDDQVDVGAYAARVAIAHWLPQEPAEATKQWIAAGQNAGLDFMTAAWN